MMKKIKHSDDGNIIMLEQLPEDQNENEYEFDQEEEKQEKELKMKKTNDNLNIMNLQDEINHQQNHYNYDHTRNSIDASQIEIDEDEISQISSMEQIEHHEQQEQQQQQHEQDDMIDDHKSQCSMIVYSDIEQNEQMLIHDHNIIDQSNKETRRRKTEFNQS